MPRISQAVLIVATLLSAWLLMQVVHELGHVSAAVITRGTVARVVLHPLEISRTDLKENPSPLVVCWGGPLLGAMAPVLVWAIAKWRRFSGAFWLQFFAGFCLIANGAYLAIGVREGIGDAGDLLKYGAPVWSLYAFGFVAIPVGLLLWNGLGASFGLGPQGQPIRWRSAVVVLVLLVMTVLAELMADLWYNH